MKFYVLKHPEKGYIAGTRDRRYFTQNLQMSRKFNRRSDATNSKNTSYESYHIKDYEQLIAECQVEEIHYWIGKEID